MNDNLQNALARLIRVVTYTFIGIIIITTIVIILSIIVSTRETNKEEQIREKIINRMIEKLDSVE